ncbi:mitochondrial carrier homolog 2 [Neodiprion pinetum]|uniref:Mitochondrial carrier homolog 2 n=1 Tax=Neodiprion lecontei TaxID=441921 RepID=A0A6J0BZX4_NEOLC|nr:mitochondrial carrier homolog 2 [Neodiprion lecontei]XP_046465355.1 mitochondrial carrier homolog 2-like [Neodiprion pinetum]
MSNFKEETIWSNIALRILVNTASHPLEYAKVLIQIGYEPIPPRPTITVFGKPALALPNIFQYVKYIKTVDGYAGCYRGLVPKLCANAISALAFQKTSENITFANEPDKQIDEDDLSDNERRIRCINELLRDLASRIAAIVVSHPFDVITLRMMAQFVGGETKYNGLVRSIIQIYRQNGISGYFAGLVPRLIGNIASLILASTATYAINKYIIQDREMRSYTAASMTFVASAITYPFLVVSHCMAVNDCGLAAGYPPQMPLYGSWIHCWAHLAANNQLKRGNSVLWRYYTGPFIIINGTAVYVNKDNFHS